jgi:hypothetical protein
MWSWWARAGWVCGRRQKECCFSVAHQLRGGSSIEVCETPGIVGLVSAIGCFDVGVVLRVCVAVEERLRAAVLLVASSTGLCAAALGLERHAHFLR